MVRRLLDGNGSAIEAMRLARVKVVAAYPITPQSQIPEKLSSLIANKKIDAKYIRVESEHSAIACVIGAQLTGIRAATASSSVGLALMHEVLGVASGCRVPIIMPVVNRALVSPWSLWCDHQDTMAERDSGWLQFYAENAQEVIDMLLMAYKIAEHKDILLPAMVCYDGFFVSHSLQNVEVPYQKTVDKFLPKYETRNMFLDVNNPMFINTLTLPNEFSEMRYQQKMAFDSALKIIPKIQEEFYKIFGRKYGLIEKYKCQNANVILVTIGSMSGTAKHIANILRKNGQKVGIIKIASFRPFPVEQIEKALKGKRVVGVLDRSAGLGAHEGPMSLEVKSALANSHTRVFGYILGLGGRDVSEETIKRIFTSLLKRANRENTNQITSWPDTMKNATNLRKIRKNA